MRINTPKMLPIYRYTGIIDVPQGGNQFITASYCSRFNFSFYPQKIRNENLFKKIQIHFELIYIICTHGV